MKNISAILESRPQRFNQIEAEASVSDALLKMCCENFDHLVVMQSGHYLGLISDHDIATRLTFFRRPLTGIQVRDIMNSGLPYCNGTDSMQDCMLLMRRHQVRFLPVFNEMEFLGVISSDDLLAETLRSSEQSGDRMVRV